MRVSLITDAPKHNLALMQLSTYHKEQGDNIILNMPLEPCDKSYGSWLYSQKYTCDINGGTGFDCIIKLPKEVMKCKPDYSLYGLDYSLGYTWRYCPRGCEFCSVPSQHNKKEHHSIWSFHDSRFQKICLLNNNTFSDPQWQETFREIWDAKLIVVDENGYDLRLLDEEKVVALKKTKFSDYIHFAWDLIKDEKQIINGLSLVKKYRLATKSIVYILVGYNTSVEEDLHRCQVVHDYGLDPYPMPYNGGTKQLRSFKRFICVRGYRKYKNLTEAWRAYK